MSESKYYKLWELTHPGGPKGLINRRQKPKERKQDNRATSCEGYAVIFFPKITGIGKANMWMWRTVETVSQTPEAAIIKFMDKIKKGEKWETYYDAGHRVRKVRLVDLGDAETGNLD